MYVWNILKLEIWSTETCLSVYSRQSIYLWEISSRWACLCKSQPVWVQEKLPHLYKRRRQSEKPSGQLQVCELHHSGDSSEYPGLQCSQRRDRVCSQKLNARLDMPPQMDYFYHESRVPSACGLTREDELEPGVISCMLVGDGAVGKTSMIVSYTSNGYPAEYRQTGFDVFSGAWFTHHPIILRALPC